jgi:hypothetical protein
MKMRRLLRGYLGPLVLCILFLAACGFPEVGIERRPTPECDVTALVAALATENTHLAIQVATMAAPAPSTPIPGPVATYIDTEIGCALDYPARWHIRATPGWLVIITSFDPASAPGIGGVPPDKAKVDLVPDKPDRSKSLEELVAEIYTQARNREALEVLWEECWELADNVPAVRMQVKGEVGGEMALLLTVINGRSLRLAGYGNTSLFDAIACTLRPIPSAEARSPSLTPSQQSPSCGSR